MTPTDLLSLISRLEEQTKLVRAPYAIVVATPTIKTLCAELRQRIEREDALINAAKKALWHMPVGNAWRRLDAAIALAEQKDTTP